jgi:hypothetical protein
VPDPMRLHWIMLVVMSQDFSSIYDIMKRVNDVKMLIIFFVDDLKGTHRHH